MTSSPAMPLTCSSYCFAASSGLAFPVTIDSVAAWISWEMRG